MRRIIIDLTPLLPGGDNGGAKILTLHLIQELAQLAPTSEFILLANNKNYTELKKYKNKQFRIINTDRYTLFSCICFSLGYCLLIARFILNKLLPPIITLSFNSFLSRSIPLPFSRKFQTFRTKVKQKTIKPTDFLFLKGDLLFCPFTAPFYKKLKIPIVSVIYDLQVHYYPYFFSEAVIHERQHHFYDACLSATRLIAISDFVKKTILEQSSLTSDKIRTIPIQLAKRLPPISAEDTDATLNFYTLTSQNYLLFPANFWAHKNHQLLFTAFNIYCHRYSNSELKLVCTGADNHLKFFLSHSLLQMGLTSKIIITGYLSDNEFVALLKRARAVIFPSLFEGFGMPILEAMSEGVPVLCSNQTCLPEVAGNAALLFDPRKPEEIVKAIHRIDTEPELATILSKKGIQHAASCGNVTMMAKEYWQVFKEAVTASTTI